ncbi:ABC transporter permease [Mycetocola spongiae]|uniref:ABC transporter permease n=1 Tax=Mycetocola spongiae TaxID=2859226 RepID=UPI001CF10C0B|nr:ABC transporter permease [Mycetocola spongiae]UCR89177.1 ABC transporter permease [Mycetocola spongiae]
MSATLLSGHELAPASVVKPSTWDRAHKPTVVMFGVMAALFLLFSLTAPGFFSFANVSNLATQIAPAVVVGVAMTFVITTGQIDLSVGSTIAFVAAISAELLQAGVQSSVVVLIALAAGAFWGTVNGWFSAYQGIPSFIVTLATMSIIRGIAQFRTGGFSIPIEKDTLIGQFGRASFLGFSYQAWVALIIVIIGIVLLHYTRFGNYVNGIGAQEESVRRAGINTRRIKMIVLGMTGLTAGIAGIMIAARLGSGSSNSGVGFELTVIAAVVLGGTDLFGGRGTVFGTLIGAVIIGMIANGLTLLGVSAFLTPILTGAVIIVAIWLNMRSAGIGAAWRRYVKKS